MILKFYADWCHPCKVLTNLIAKLGQEHTLADIQEIDIQTPEGKALAMKYEVRGIPCMVKLDDTQAETYRVVGLVSESKLLAFVKETQVKAAKENHE